MAARTTAHAPPGGRDADGLTTLSLAALIELARPAASLRQRPAAGGNQPGGVHLATKGRGMDYDHTRLYQQGDDIRHLDWRVTARTGKAHTKLFREEQERPVFICVDDRRPMRFATRGVFKSVQAAKIAALLAWAAQQRGDRVGGQLFAEQHCQELRPQHGRQAVLLFLQALLHTGANHRYPGSLAQVFARLGRHARPGSAIHVISDFRGFDAAAATQLARLGQHCHLQLLFVYDPFEAWLPVGSYRLSDGQHELNLEVSAQQQQAHAGRFQQRWQPLQAFANQQGFKIRQCQTTDDPAQVLR